MECYGIIKEKDVGLIEKIFRFFFANFEPFKAFKKFKPLKTFKRFAPFKPFKSNKTLDVNLICFLKLGKN
jgi:hypothetical protein